MVFFTQEKICTMTHKEAMRILDKVKDGVPYPEKIILMALEMTGDLVV